MRKSINLAPRRTGLPQQPVQPGAWLSGSWRPTPGFSRFRLGLLVGGHHLLGCLAASLALLLAGCATPIGADKVTTRQAYAQVEETALRSGRMGADTVAVLHRLDLDRLASRHPDQAVRPLHERALATGDRDLLFALAELSYAAGDHLRRSAIPRKTRDPRDYYLGSAVYAWLFLVGGNDKGHWNPFDPRFRLACDYYNYGLGQALADRSATNAMIRLEEGSRRMPVGGMEVRFGQTNLAVRLNEFENLISADRFRIRGLNVRNRVSGMGAPVVGLLRVDPELGVSRCTPATVILRVQSTLADLDAGQGAGSLELYSAYEHSSITVGDLEVPLGNDLTTHAAYALNQSSVWKLGKLQFRTPDRDRVNRLIPQHTFRRGRIPIVLVHGTFSSPVTWAGLNNTLTADPVLRQRFQIWNFMYGTGNPLPVSAADLRDSLAAAVRAADPEGQDADLRQMVVIGHSQGGLLTKLTATHTGDTLWRAISPTPIDQVDLSEDERAALRRLFVVEPVPFIRRVIFISTPHRGSYLASNFARRLGARLVSLPASVAAQTKQVLSFSPKPSTEAFLGGRMPTSLDSMSPRNPVLLALADLPVSPGIKAHSIIPVRGDGDFHEGRDGLVAYPSAHIEPVESELVVRGDHSCQNLPATIEEVRRILHEHLKLVDSEASR